jgi:Tol biopolymer transport system component/predicted Ser/Thr protein kinase
MPLSAGDRLGPYEIIAPIGAGGMGEVYRARDTRLNRIVAIKVSKEQFSERFELEARAVAALNHSNICILHDVGPNFLVMELVEGRTLAERIREGAIPLEESVAMARQIADALAAAHDKGIVHRDLKPANLKVTPQGVVKVLDFGLAKAVSKRSALEDRSISSTETVGLTQAGVILGTAPYMAPEQAQGKPVNKQTDIWAFGVVLYEMLTGRNPFLGDTVTDTLASVIKEEPEWDRVPAKTRRLLKKCLEKDPKRRLRDIGDAWILLEEESPAETRRQRLSWLWPSVAAVLLLAALTLGFLYLRHKAPAADAVRFEIAPPDKVTVGNSFDVSPDGRKLAFLATGEDGIPRFWIRSFETFGARPLSGTEGANAPPIWSPDSRFIAYDAGGKLKKIDIASGPAQTICELPGLAVGGSWNKDGVIIFGNDAPGVGLMRVSATGGKVSPLTNIDRSRNESIHVLPSFLPDGRHFIYYRGSHTPENSGTYVGSIDTEPGKQDSRELLVSASARYAPSLDSSPGQLLFLRGGTLMAQPFDPTRLQFAGEPMPVAEQVGSYLALGFFSISANGILVYRTRARDFLLTWLDRQGNAIGRVWEPGPYTSLSVSPDGTRAVVSRNDLSQGATVWNLWLLDLARGTSKRFTSKVGRNDAPVWSPDGSRIVFASSREGGTAALNLYQKLASGAEDEDVLLRSNETKIPTSWSRDGRFLLYTVADQKTKDDIWVLSMDGDHQRTRLLGTEFNESEAQFSHDSRWIAYTSDASGRDEVYVRAFPEAKEDFVVSQGGGSSPRWRDDGRELYYISSDGKVMAADVAAGGLFQAGTPKPLFQVSSGVLAAWNVNADGKRFLFAVPVEQTQAPFKVVLNWTAALRRK